MRTETRQRWRKRRRRERVRARRRMERIVFAIGSAFASLARRMESHDESQGG